MRATDECTAETDGAEGLEHEHLHLKMRGRLVLTDMRTGLTADRADEVIRILMR